MGEEGQPTSTPACYVIINFLATDLALLDISSTARGRMGAACYGNNSATKVTDWYQR